jgi:hypothetical protein
MEISLLVITLAFLLFYTQHHLSEHVENDQTETHLNIGPPLCPQSRACDSDQLPPLVNDSLHR